MTFVLLFFLDGAAWAFSWQPVTSVEYLPF